MSSESHATSDARRRQQHGHRREAVAIHVLGHCKTQSWVTPHACKQCSFGAVEFGKKEHQGGVLFAPGCEHRPRPPPRPSPALIFPVTSVLQVLIPTWFGFAFAGMIMFGRRMQARARVRFFFPGLGSRCSSQFFLGGSLFFAVMACGPGRHGMGLAGSISGQYDHLMI